MGSETDESDPGTLLAGFGEARLMQYKDGRVELVGRTKADRKAALEFLARYLPHVRRSLPRRKPSTRGK